MKIAVLHAGRAPASLIPMFGDYDDMSKALLGYGPSEAETYTVFEDEFPNAPELYDLFIITGSPCGVYAPLPWIPTLEDFIRDAYKTNIKLIGLCFGHQIIAQALGGTVIKSEKGYGIGVMDYVLDDLGQTQDISLCAWHQDQVIKAPPIAEIFMSSEFCPVAGLRYGEKVISFQPHPEFSTAFIKNLINVRRGDTITDAQAQTALSSLSKTTQTDAIQDILTQFLLG